MTSPIENYADVIAAEIDKDHRISANLTSVALATVELPFNPDAEFEPNDDTPSIYDTQESK